MSTGEAASPEPVPSASAEPDGAGGKARYEFTPEQDRVIGDLAGKMGFVGAFLMSLALLGFVRVGYIIWLGWKADGRFVFDAFTALNALFYGCLGLWTMRASGAFAAVVVTVGRDITHIMDALSSLRKMYSLLYWLLIAALLATLVLLLSFSLR